MEKRVRKRKTRRGKKKTRKPLIKVSSDPTHDQQHLIKSVNIHGKHNQSSAGNVGRCGNYSYTHSQNSSTEIDNHDSNIDKTCTVRDARVVPLANHCTTSEVTGHHNVAFTEDNALLDGTDQNRTANATGIRSCHHSEDLFLLVKKENGE